MQLYVSFKHIFTFFASNTNVVSAEGVQTATNILRKFRKYHVYWLEFVNIKYSWISFHCAYVLHHQLPVKEYSAHSTKLWFQT